MGLISVQSTKSNNDRFIYDSSVCALYPKPCLASQSLCSPTVFLDVHLSLSGSTTLGLSASLWTSVYFLLHQSSWLQTPPLYRHQTLFFPPLPNSPHRPAFSTPLSCFPQTPAVNHLCLSCSPPHSALSCRRPAQHSLLFVLTRLFKYAHWMGLCPFRFIKNKLDMEKCANG